MAAPIKRRPSTKDIVEVYSKKGANISATCTALDISRNTLYAWRRKSKKLDEAMTEVEEALIDFTESKLIEQINTGNITAIIFHLKTKGKNRGYVERQELTGEDGEDLFGNYQIEIIDSTDKVDKE